MLLPVYVPSTVEAASSPKGTNKSSPGMDVQLLLLDFRIEGLQVPSWPSLRQLFVCGGHSSIVSFEGRWRRWRRWRHSILDKIHIWALEYNGHVSVREKRPLTLWGSESPGLRFRSLQKPCRSCRSMDRPSDDTSARSFAWEVVATAWGASVGQAWTTTPNGIG